MRNLSQLFFFCLLSSPLFGQNPNPKAEHYLRQFHEGYNTENYKMMRRSMGGPLKLIFTKKLLKRSFGAQLPLMGRVGIGKTDWTAKSCKAKLVYERDTTEGQVWRFAFSKKGKIIGFGSKGPEFWYAKSQKPAHINAVARIDSVVSHKHVAGGFSGCVAVVEDGKAIYKNCYGQADQKTGAPLTPQSVFELASCSKAFTAMGIAILEQKGKLKSSDLLSRHIPELAFYEGVTLSHLLGHTSGLPDYMELMEKHWDKQKIAGNEDVIALLVRHKPKRAFKPGNQYEYSNTGYALLASVIERSTGMSYGSFLQANIFQPLGMKNTRVYNTRRSGESIPNYAYGYIYDVRKKTLTLPDELPDYTYVRYLDGITGDGTVNSNLEDLILWDKALRSDRLIPEEAMEKLFNPHLLNNGGNTGYAYGWEILEKKDHETVIQHSGSWPGYHTFLLRFKDRPRSVIILSNNEYTYINYLSDRVLKALGE